MCKIRIRDDDGVPPPRGSAPPLIRKALCGIIVDATERLPRGKAVDFLPGEGGSSGIFVSVRKLSRALRERGRENAAIYYERLRVTGKHWTHIQIDADACEKIAA